MNLLCGPWRAVARLTHLAAPAQRRLWRLLILGWTLLLLAAWAGLSAFTRVEEKAAEEAGQTYVQVAPLAAEVNAGIGPDRLRIQLTAGPAPEDAQTLSLNAQALSLRELVEVLRDLKVEAGLTTVSAHMAPAASDDNRMDLNLVLSR